MVLDAKMTEESVRMSIDSIKIYKPILNRSRSMLLIMSMYNQSRLKLVVVDRLRHQSALIIDVNIRGLS